MKSQENWEEFEWRVRLSIYTMYSKYMYVNADMPKWGTNSWEIEETTSHKTGSSAVFKIAFERTKKKKKKRSYYNTEYSYYFITHPGRNLALGLYGVGVRPLGGGWRSPPFGGLHLNNTE